MLKPLKKFGGFLFYYYICLITLKPKAMGKTYKLGKITKEDQIKMAKAAGREWDIENGRNVNYHRVHKNKKGYNRSENKRAFEWAE